VPVRLYISLTGASASGGRKDKEPIAGKDVDIPGHVERWRSVGRDLNGRVNMGDPKPEIWLFHNFTSIKHSLMYLRDSQARGASFLNSPDKFYRSSSIITRSSSPSSTSSYSDLTSTIDPYKEKYASHFVIILQSPIQIHFL
jgi:hypothetical protein